MFGVVKHYLHMEIGAPFVLALRKNYHLLIVG